MTYNVTAINAFNDNYIWVISDNTSVIVVDPGDANPVLSMLKTHNLSLSTILLTHHHHDHTGGIGRLLEAYPDCQIIAPYNETIAPVHKRIQEADTFRVGANPLDFGVIQIPGHTLDHVAYVTQDWVFCGDTLFAAGCGRLFEGTPKQMVSSLAKLKNLKDEMLVFCGHEYTLTNLEFARYIEPGNVNIQQRYKEVGKLRKQNTMSLPTNIHLEKLTNPFLRCLEPEVIDAAQKYNQSQNLACINLNQSKEDIEIQVFKAIREAKNRF